VFLVSFSQLPSAHITHYYSVLDYRIVYYNITLDSLTSCSLLVHEHSF